MAAENLFNYVFFILAMDPSMKNNNGNKVQGSNIFLFYTSLLFLSYFVLFLFIYLFIFLIKNSTSSKVHVMKWDYFN